MSLTRVQQQQVLGNKHHRGSNVNNMYLYVISLQPMFLYNNNNNTI